MFNQYFIESKIKDLVASKPHFFTNLTVDYMNALK
jgi:hypothetical protein